MRVRFDSVIDVGTKKVWQLGKTSIYSHGYCGVIGNIAGQQRNLYRRDAAGVAGSSPASIQPNR